MCRVQLGPPCGYEEQESSSTSNVPLGMGHDAKFPYQLALPPACVSCIPSWPQIHYESKKRVTWKPDHPVFSCRELGQISSPVLRMEPRSLCLVSQLSANGRLHSQEVIPPNLGRGKLCVFFCSWDHRSLCKDPLGLKAIKKKKSQSNF